LREAVRHPASRVGVHADRQPTTDFLLVAAYDLNYNVSNSPPLEAIRAGIEAEAL
jgi:hypothetical protein